MSAWSIRTFGPFNIIDVGAYVGDNALPWAAAHKACFIYAIDPSPENCEFIGKMASINNIPNIKIIQTAIGSSPDEVLRYNGELEHCMFGKGDQSAKSTSFDSLFETGQLSNIGFIHLDVESMEWDVVRGAQILIDSSLPFILFEAHLRSDKFLPLLSCHLKEKGYKIFMVKERLKGCRRDCRNFISIPPKHIPVNMSIFVSPFV